MKFATGMQTDSHVNSMDMNDKEWVFTIVLLRIH